MTRLTRTSQAGRPQQPHGAWTGRTRGGYLGNWIFLTLLRHLSLRWAYALLVPVTFYYLFMAREAVKASRDYLRRLGLLNRRGLWRLTYRHFYSFGQTLLDRVAILSGHASRFVFEFDGEANLAQAMTEGKGVIILSAHFGNWQAGAHLLGTLQVPVNIVAYEREVAPIRQLFTEAFKDRLFSVIPLENPEGASLEIMSALRRGEIVALHGDRILDPTSSLGLPFLGETARFPTGPFVVAALSGAPLVHTFAVREKTFSYRLRAFPPEHLSFGKRSERRQQLGVWMELFVERLEAYVKKYPLQWYNFYDFWGQA